MLFFSGSEHWKPFINKRPGEFLAAGTIIGRFRGLKAMKNILGLDETPPASNKLKHELSTDVEMESILLGELSSMVEDIYVKAREASQNTDVDMREFLRIDKVLQSTRVNS